MPEIKADHCLTCTY